MKSTALLLNLFTILLGFSSTVFAQQGMRIGSTAAPSEMLQVDGAIKIGTDFNNSTAAPAGGAGTIRWNSTQSRFEGWDGSTWVLLSSAGTDDQDLENATLSGASLLSIGIEDGTGISVSLAALEESADIATVQSNLDAHTTADNDLSATNEIQNISLSGTSLGLSGSTPASVSLSAFDQSAHVSADGDLSATNELQSLSQSGLNVTLSNGGGTISVADNDNSVTNEIQVLSISGSTISLNNGGGSVTVPSSADNLGNHSATQALDMNSFKITELATPTANTDAANKAYVDAHTDADSNPSNEIQNLGSSASGTDRTITISGGGSSTTISVADNDNSATNEIQNAAQVVVTPTGNLAADDVQEALQELQTDIDNIAPTIEDVLSNGDVAADGQNLEIDKVRARDGDGLLLTDDNNKGVFIEDGGNIGIGTNDPEFLLDVAGPGTNQGPISSQDNIIARFEQSNTASGLGIQIRGYRNSSGNVASFIDLMNFSSSEYIVARMAALRGAGEEGSLLFYTNSGSALTEQMRINNAGTVQLNAYTTNGIVRATGGNGTLSTSGGGINLASEVTGVLPIANGGTNTSSLTGNRLMVSNAAGSAIVENAALAANSGPIYTNANGLPTLTAPSTGAQGYWTRTGTNLSNTTLTDNVGIGYSTPQTKLHVGDRIGVLNGNREWTIGAGRANGATNGYPDAAAITDGSFAIRDVWEQRDRLRIDASGNVGIGTTSPTMKLAINAGTGGYDVGIRQNVVGGTHTMELSTGDATGDPTTKILMRGGTDVGDIEFYTGASGSEVQTMIINGTSGNVGIGGAASTYKLDVSGDSRSTGSVYAGGAMIIQSADPYFRTDGNDKHIVLSGGSGWAATAATMVLRGANATYNTHGIEMYTGNTERLRILSNGNVGIGHAAPAYKLDVNGEIRSNGVYRGAGTYFLALQGDNNMVYYSNGGCAVWASGTSCSDIRKKTQIVALEDMLPTIMQLSTIRFHYKKELKLDNDEHIGVIAQEIQQHFPDMVYYDEEADSYVVYYDKLTTVLIKGMQEQQAQIERLQEENASVNKKLENYASLVSDIELLKEAVGIDNQAKK